MENTIDIDKLNKRIDEISNKVILAAGKIIAIIAPAISSFFTYQALTESLKTNHETALMFTIACSMLWGMAIIAILLRSTPFRTDSKKRIPNIKLLLLPVNFSPKNEQGVVFAFGEFAKANNIKIIEIGTRFPDATISYKGQVIEIEFEYISTNFRTHKHDENKCDMIVCWNHDWEDCPLPVLELSSGKVY